MANVKVTSDMVRSVKEQVNIDNEKMKELIERANNRIQGLVSWEGEAKQQYLQTFNALKADLDKGYEMIRTQYVPFMEQTAQNYDDAETALKASNASFMGQSSFLRDHKGKLMSRLLPIGSDGMVLIFQTKLWTIH